MRRFLVAIVLSVYAVAGAGDAAKWTPHKSSAGNFSAAFPGKPRSMSQELHSQAGTMHLNWSAYEQGKDAVYLVAYCDLPVAIMKRATPPVLLDQFQAMLGKRFGKPISRAKKILFKGIPGREATFAGGNGLSAHMRVYLSKNRVYIAAFGWRGSADQSADAKRFFGSFNIF